MWRHATQCGFLLAALAGRAAQLPRPDDPSHFTPADRRAMLDVVRRTAAMKDAAPLPTGELPAKLLRSTGRPLIVSAHWPGAEPLAAVAREGTLLEQLVAAARTLRDSPRRPPLPTLRFKIDLIISSAPVHLGPGGQPALGIQGVHVRTPAQELYLAPSEALRLGLPDGEALVRHALGRLKAEGLGLRDVAIERFATESFIEREPGGFGPPVDLYRGRPLVERVTRPRVLAAAEAAAEWLLRFQKPDGSFHYLYNAAKDTVDDEGYEAVRHAGTTWSLAQAAAATGQRRFRDGAYRALEWLLGHERARGDVAWIEHGGRCSLGTAALTAVALLEYRAAAGTRRFDRSLRRLGRFLVFMQTEDGFFWSDYDPEAHRGVLPEGHVPLYAPGEAFLALVRLQRVLPDPAWLAAATKAADFAATKRDAWYLAHDLPMIHPDAWTLMALDELHALGASRRAHADYAFFLAQQIIGEQETPASASWRDHVGAPRSPASAPEVGPAAGRCEGLLAAWRLGRRMGVATDGYERAILLAARFILEHQADAVNGYLFANPSRAAGGFFASYADPSIRIDHVQHSLSALLGIAAVLDEAK